MIDSAIFTLFSDVMDLVTIHLNNINLSDNNNFDEDGPANIFLIRLMVRCIRLKQFKPCKKR